MNLCIVPVLTPPEIARTAALAAEIWAEYYTPLIGAEQVAYMIEHFQSAGAIGRAIGQDGYRYYIAVDGGADAGYCGVLGKDGDLFISKLYVRNHARGRGIARRLFEHAVADHPGTRRAWLTVNKGNAGAIAVYQKMGFIVETELCTDIGGGFVMDDYQMGVCLT